MMINRLELVKIVAAKLEVKQKMVNSILGEIIETIEESVADGDEVLIVGFGTFKPHFRKARKCRNPKSGEVVETTDTTIPVFKAGKRFKERLKNLS